MVEKCRRCGRVLRNAESIRLGYGKTCYNIIKLQGTNNLKQQERFDMKEIKMFINLEIQKALKEFNFNGTIINDNTENAGILSIKTTKIPKFNPIEVNKRLVVKELKEQLQKGINNILQEVGSFDDKINFLEPIGILA